MAKSNNITRRSFMGTAAIAGSALSVPLVNAAMATETASTIGAAIAAYADAKTAYAEAATLFHAAYNELSPFRWEPWTSKMGKFHSFDRWRMSDAKLYTVEQAKGYFAKDRARARGPVEIRRDSNETAEQLAGWVKFFERQRQDYLATIDRFEQEALAYLEEKEATFAIAEQRLNIPALEEALSKASSRLEMAWEALLDAPCMTLSDVQRKVETIFKSGEFKCSDGAFTRNDLIECHGYLDRLLASMVERGA